MLLPFMMLICLFSSSIYSGGDMPQYAVVQDVLEESEMAQLNELTNNPNPELLWYNRYNFLKENFEAKFDDTNQNFTFTHSAKHPFDHVSDKLSKLFLTKAQELGVEIAKKRIILQSYFDRNSVDSKNFTSSGLFWHRDSILVGQNLQIADCALLLLTNGKIQNWKGAKVIIQKGGDYDPNNASSWINSDSPEITVTPRYNQAIIFKNSDTGHMVTPLIPLSSESLVNRDVFIMNCYFQ